jgi:hypothetical protein
MVSVTITGRNALLLYLLPLSLTWILVGLYLLEVQCLGKQRKENGTVLVKPELGTESGKETEPLEKMMISKTGNNDEPNNVAIANHVRNIQSPRRCPCCGWSGSVFASVPGAPGQIDRPDARVTGPRATPSRMRFSRIVPRSFGRPSGTPVVGRTVSN